MRWTLCMLATCLSGMLLAQRIPEVYSNLSKSKGKIVFSYRDSEAIEVERPTRFGLARMMGNPSGTDEGIAFDFGEAFQGVLFYGFIPYGDSQHPLPVYFRSRSPIQDGRAYIDIANDLKGRYDMVGWEAQRKGTLGYRVVDASGQFVYDGIVSFTGTGPFSIDQTIVEGPFVNRVGPYEATISFTTNVPTKARLVAGPHDITEVDAAIQHEIHLTGLQADSLYPYKVYCGASELEFSFRTAPLPGSRSSFCFAYASDSRSGQGGGERSIYGANAYIMKKITSVAKQEGAAFMQFSGDLIDGYLSDVEDMRLQYANWKRAIQPFAHYFPVYVSMGNHEALVREMVDPESGYRFQIDRFPFDTESSEQIFAENFVNPLNGPVSEDGAYYDPDDRQQNFPSYRENVFYYVHDNVAMVVLNSDYWYTPTTGAINRIGGGLHGYIMDVQLQWLDSTIQALEANADIDHIFITQHTPCFPNGGHVGDDMWYRGNNDFRPWVAGKPLREGIIQRRDQILEIIVNKSQKVRAVLTGDEHNYNRLELTPDTEIYPDTYLPDKIKLSRTIFQINNGAAGAPYYAQEETPWTPFVSNFTTQNALVFFHVEGPSIWVEVINPDTLEKVDQFWLVE